MVNQLRVASWRVDYRFWRERVNGIPSFFITDGETGHGKAVTFHSSGFALIRDAGQTPTRRHTCFKNTCQISPRSPASALWTNPRNQRSRSLSSLFCSSFSPAFMFSFSALTKTKVTIARPSSRLIPQRRERTASMSAAGS